MAPRQTRYTVLRAREREDGQWVFDTEIITLTWPVRVQVVTRAYHAGERIPWDRAVTAAVCNSIRGLRRRYQDEYARTHSRDGMSWSGHVRMIDAAGLVLYPAGLRRIEQALEWARDYPDTLGEGLGEVVATS
jgi:hypothetical protein